MKEYNILLWFKNEKVSFIIISGRNCADVELRDENTMCQAYTKYASGF